MTQADTLIAIAQRNGGRITPAEVIEEAKSPESVLHNAFTWDDTKAAEKWRTYEAQKLIRECRITVEKDNGETVKTFAFIGVSTDRTNESNSNPYRLAWNVAQHNDLLDAALNDALMQLKAVKARYAHLSSLRPVWDALDNV